MNGAMKIENIYEYTAKLGIQADQNFIYTQVPPTLFKSPTLGADAGFDYQVIILVFEKQALYLLGVNLSGDLAYEYMKIDKENIKSMTFKKGFMQNNMTVELTEGKIFKFIIPNIILTSKWQKKNLNYLIENNWMQ